MVLLETEYQENGLIEEKQKKLVVNLSTRVMPESRERWSTHRDE